MEQPAAEEEQVAHLVALEDDVQPATRWLAAALCLLGRSPLCQVFVPRQIVSRHHAQIEPAGARFLLRDLDSANGTYVNGRRLVEPHLLVDGDQIGLGSAVGILRFIDPDSTYTATSRLRFDERELRFYLGQEPIELTPNQFRLLRHLYEHLGQVRSRESCAEAVWGPDYVPGHDADNLDRLVSMVRATLRRVEPGAQFIETRAGLGYRLM